MDNFKDFLKAKETDTTGACNKPSIMFGDGDLNFPEENNQNLPVVKKPVISKKEIEVAAEILFSVMRKGSEAIECLVEALAKVLPEFKDTVIMIKKITEASIDRGCTGESHDLNKEDLLRSDNVSEDGGFIVPDSFSKEIFNRGHVIIPGGPFEKIESWDINEPPPPKIEVGDSVRFITWERLKEIGQQLEDSFVLSHTRIITKMFEYLGKIHKIESFCGYKRRSFTIEGRGTLSWAWPIECIAEVLPEEDSEFKEMVVTPNDTVLKEMSFFDGMQVHLLSSEKKQLPDHFAIDLSDDNSEDMQAAVQEKLFGLGYRHLWNSDDNFNDVRYYQGPTIYMDKSDKAFGFCVRACNNCRYKKDEECKNQTQIKADDFLKNY